MSVFGSIVSAIFGSKHGANVAPAAGATAAPPSSPGTTASAGAAPTTGASPGSSTITPISRADVEAILKKLHDEQREDFDWRKLNWPPFRPDTRHNLEARGYPQAQAYV